MEFEELWLKLVRDKPRLDDPESQLRINSRNLRRLLEQFYERGRADGAPERWGADGAAMFDRMFGGGFGGR